MIVRSRLLSVTIAIVLGSSAAEAKDAYGVLFRHLTPLHLKRTPHHDGGLIKGGAIQASPESH